MTENSRNLEWLVQKIQQQLAPTAEVLHNVYPTRRNQQSRLANRCPGPWKIGQYEILRRNAMAELRIGS